MFNHDYYLLYDFYCTYAGGGSSRGSKTDLAGMVELTETHL